MSRSRNAWGMLVPRPHAFLANGLMFAMGLFFAWLEGQGGQGGNERPALPLWLFVLLWFVVQELLVQQAKYIWNDIRDHEQDQRIPANRNRPLAKRPLSTTTTRLMAVRWITGLLLAAWLSAELLAVVLLISLLQIIYERWAKPNSARWPALPLFVVGAGAVLKAGGGFLALGWPAGDQRAWFYGLAMFATGVVYVSSFWRVEAVYFAAAKLPLPRGQSAYFAHRGLNWLKVGTAVTIIACILLFFDGSDHFLALTELNTGLVFIFIFAAGIVSCRLCFWLVSGPRQARLAALVLFIAGCAAYLWLTGDRLFPLWRDSLAAALLLLLLLINHRLNYGVDYRRMTLIYLSDNWPSLRRIARRRFQQSHDVIQWRQLARLILALNTPKYKLLREQLEK